MKIKTSELTDVALDWAVGYAMQYVTHDTLGWTVTLPVPSTPPTTTPPLPFPRNFSPSTRWAQGGPIIESEGIELRPNKFGATGWTAWTLDRATKTQPRNVGKSASSPLIAAMRCYVASKLGSEVDVPDEFAEAKP